MKNIVFIINSIGSGGAESALFNILKTVPDSILSEARVHLVLLDDEPRLKIIPEGIIVHQLEAKRSLIKSLKQCYALFVKIKPSIVISFLVRANIVNSILRAFSRYSASIVCERMHLSSHLSSQFTGFKAKVAEFLPWLLYAKNDLVLGVSSGVSYDLIQRYRLSQEKVKTIYNPFDIALLQSQALQALPQALSLPDNYMVSVGRLTKSKDYETLIRAFAKANTRKSLVIVGTGDLHHSLSQLAKHLQVSERVIFTGYLKNPHPVIAKADYYIATSRNEGFPNALVESMALGKAIIFTSCDSGPAEILGRHHHFKANEACHCEYGVLVPEGDIESVANAMTQYEDPELLKHYSMQSLKRAQDFTLNEISGHYWDEIRQLI